MTHLRPYTEVSLLHLGIATGLLALSILASRLQKLDLEKDFAIGTVRSFVQLFAIGYILEAIFKLNSAPLVIAVLLIMTLVASQTASGRVGRIPGGLWLCYAAIGIGALGTLLAMVAVGVIQPKPWHVIPVGGMVLSNAMNGVAILLNRLKGEYALRRGEIESALSLGATSGAAVRAPRKEAIRASMIPTINGMMVIGLVALPGMMTGQIIAGHPATEAVRYQLVVSYMIGTSVVASVLIAAALSHRRFFTRDHQLTDTVQ